EVTLAFAKEGNDWKLSDQTFGPDPDKITACHDDPVESESAYDHSVSGNAGGVIRRVEFKTDHALVVIRIVDEENCIILPTRDLLAAHNGRPQNLVPWASITVDGMPHHDDKRRIWADRWTITDEE